MKICIVIVQDQDVPDLTERLRAEGHSFTKLASTDNVTLNIVE